MIDITSSSRIGSIGGFVTWAKSWWKWSKSDRGLFERHASAASLPIAQTGSAPVSAIGRRMSSTSSSVQPKRACSRSSAERPSSPPGTADGTISVKSPVTGMRFSRTQRR